MKNTQEIYTAYLQFALENWWRIDICCWYNWVEFDKDSDDSFWTVHFFENWPDWCEWITSRNFIETITEKSFIEAIARGVLKNCTSQWDWIFWLYDTKFWHLEKKEFELVLIKQQAIAIRDNQLEDFIKDLI